MQTFKQYIKKSVNEMASGVSAKAQQAEISAFNKLKAKTKAQVLVSPAGFDAGFPDFGFRVHLPSGKKIDVHIEYKADYKAQMGSMRDWRFDGTKYTTPDTASESKQELIAVMNSTPEAIKNGKRLLADMQKFISPDIKQIYSGSLTVIKDKQERKSKTMEFASGTDNYQIAKIQNTAMGNQIIKHYKNKFKKNLVNGSDGDVLLMMLKDKVWLVDTNKSVNNTDLKQLAQVFGINSFTNLTNLTAALEVRIQPRGLNSPSKPASIDVMASFRLSAAPAGGGKVI